MSSNLDKYVKLSIIALALAGVYYFVIALPSKNTQQISNQLPQPSNSPITTATISATTSPCKNISETEAVQSVHNLPGVSIFLNEMVKVNQKVMFIPTNSTDKNGDSSWNIQVAEDHPDHIVTFGRYSVNKCTGAINKQL